MGSDLKPLYILRCTFFFTVPTNCSVLIMDTEHFQYSSAIIFSIKILNLYTYFNQLRGKKVSKECLRSSFLECLEKSWQEWPAIIKIAPETGGGAGSNKTVLVFVFVCFPPT